MNFRTMSCVAGAAFIFAMLMIALLLPLQSTYVLDHRFVLANSAHLFGTDEMERDMLSRFLAGGKYTILTGFTTTLLACASGYLMGAGVRIAPNRSRQSERWHETGLAAATPTGFRGSLSSTSWAMFRISGF
ncbi:MULTISPECIES: hypothetical protein [unclassified Agrobacterium]|uniref:hypothetical protein n=1 Tax=unclassified Agrobacterium TaxID=2632611 RepID=UPI00244D0A03|nr:MULTISPECIES: hypothetical protein [unclassified Agrobacterium]MDH0616687.1 hypothetical protein [Agrobacterium sp. GD03872]MDH0699278.1 hypothetical protein [Agrobacterium sp. GD03871]MDH1062028.1 hypothetical protein [Agrobacterium sp. GD03992]MDH2213550.1 hypothetical protein [Agrobacterium sp. GD03643]MDH2220133.1 hypothetical protein [Agrobacterium sp. GD03638]